MVSCVLLSVINIREVYESSAVEVQMIILKLRRHKSQSIDQIQAELIHVEGRTIFPEITKLINSILNHEELLEQWKNSIIVPSYKKGDKTAYSNYRGISYLSITYKMFFNILLPLLSTKAEEIIWDH